jgi:hypothetical protein
VTAAPARQAIRIGATPGSAGVAEPAEPGWEADVYVPAGRGPFPAIVVSLGVNQAARDDPRVRELGDGLSRLGFVVLIPAHDELRAQRLTPDAGAMLVAAHRALAARPDVDPGRVGLFGVCVGASLAALAAEEPAIAGDVAWVAWFGGYYRLDTLIAAVLSGSKAELPDPACLPGAPCARVGAPRPWTVDPLTDRVIRSHLGEIDDPTGTVRRLLEGEPAFDEALAALGDLPREATARMAALSPATELAQLRAPLYTMSDVGDPLIPHTETAALDRAAARLGVLERAQTFDVFRHVDLDPFQDPGTTLPELWRLYRHVHAIVRAGIEDG